MYTYADVIAWLMLIFPSHHVTYRLVRPSATLPVIRLTCHASVIWRSGGVAYNLHSPKRFTTDYEQQCDQQKIRRCGWWQRGNDRDSVTQPQQAPFGTLGLPLCARHSGHMNLIRECDLERRLLLHRFHTHSTP